jgi:hypothetical protein
MVAVSDYAFSSTGYGYPLVITEGPDPFLSYQQGQYLFFENNRFSSSPGFDRFVFGFHPDDELYNANKKKEPNPMRLVGTMIDLYA